MKSLIKTTIALVAILIAFFAGKSFSEVRYNENVNNLKKLLHEKNLENAKLKDSIKLRNSLQR